MTTATMRYHRPPWWIPIIILAIGIAVIALAIPQVVPSIHPEIKHPEAEQIRQCAANPDNWLSIWINSSDQRFNCLIEMPGGQVADYVLQLVCRLEVYKEVTAFIMTDALKNPISLQRAIQILELKGCKKLWEK